MTEATGEATVRNFELLFTFICRKKIKMNWRRQIEKGQTEKGILCF